MIKLNLDLFNDNYDLFKLVAVERLRFSKELLNINGFRTKLEVIKYSTVERYAQDICDEYNNVEDLQEGEDFVLIFNWLIDEAVHHLYYEDLEVYDWNNGEGLTQAIVSYVMCNLTSCYEDIEEGLK